MNFKLSLIAVASLLTASFFLSGFGKPVQSNIDAQIEQHEDGKLTINFRIAMKEGIEVNDEGPWTLEITGHPGLVIEKTKYEFKDFDQKMPGFAVQASAKPGAEKGELSYRLVAYICTANKVICYRETFTEEITKVIWEL